GDTLTVLPSLSTDLGDHVGYVAGDVQHCTITKDGVTLADLDTGLADILTVPATPGKYEVTSSRPFSTLDIVSSTITSTWTFPSGHVDGTAAEYLPVSAIRFTPVLSADQKAPAGRP